MYILKCLIFCCQMFGSEAQTSFKDAKSLIGKYMEISFAKNIRSRMFSSKLVVSQTLYYITVSYENI